jgi:hypothetical protein
LLSIASQSRNIQARIAEQGANLGGAFAALMNGELCATD